MLVLTLVPCAQDDARKCKHGLIATCTMRDATHENLRLANLDPEEFQDAICMVEDRNGGLLLCRYCGSFRVKGDGEEWHAPTENRKVL